MSTIYLLLLTTSGGLLLAVYSLLQAMYWYGQSNGTPAKRREGQFAEESYKEPQTAVR